MNRPLSIRPDAEAEIAEAHDWYEERRPGLGADFLSEVRKALADIEEFPERYPVVRNDVRRRLLNRFPYSILFLTEPKETVIIACFHGRRDPKRWHSRT